MGEMTIRGIDDRILERLKRFAIERGITPEEAARIVLTEALRPSRQEALATADRIRAMTLKRIENSSTNLIRADRDRR